MPGKPAVPAFQRPASEVTVSTSPGTVTGGVVSVDGPPVDLPPVDVGEPDPVPGPWGCNAAAGCVNDAVLQWAYPAPTKSDPSATVPVFACSDHEGLA